MSAFKAMNGIVLGCSAYYLTKQIKKLTSKKPNNCLLVWHIMNVFVGSILIVASGILFAKWVRENGQVLDWYDCMHDPSCGKAYRVYMYFCSLELIPCQYFNLFLLMLIYRFTKPQDIKKMPRFSGSYDVEEASETVRNSVNRVNE